VRKSGSALGSARNLSSQRNNFYEAGSHGQSKMESIGFDEESKYDTEAQYDGTKLPPLANTPSVLSVKSKQTPSIQPRIPMQKLSNKKLIKNAI